ncbi:hypothetical protein QBC43DRAFT_317364 [Cladorrhinum sp. PSN259]|nr:hypothetical protein QBC43DRAFT_317364 [Cladorrhinum sp. PSN259]
MAPITQLSTEIWTVITTEFSPAEISVLCLVSKDVRRQVEPLLYRNICMTWQRDRPPPILELIRTLALRHELFSHIRRLSLLGNDLCGCMDEKSLVIPITHISRSPEWPTILALLKRTELSPGFLMQWREKVGYGNVDAIVALLIAQLHRLTHLHLDLNFTRKPLMVGTIMWLSVCERDKGSDALPKFESLVQVHHINTHGTDRSPQSPQSNNTTYVLPFFFLPRVQFLSLGIDNPKTSFEWPADDPPIQSTLTTLKLTGIREAHLEHILSACKVLKSLSWEWNYTFGDSNAANTRVIDLDQITAALLPVRETLVDLKITASCSCNVDNEYPNLVTKGTMNDLKLFPKLKRLEAPVLFLTRFACDTHFENVIPPSVEKLVINYDLFLQGDFESLGDEPVLEKLLLWTRKLPDCAPNLDRILLFVKSLEDPDGGTWRQDLRDACHRLGIDLAINPVPSNHSGG